jgi:outer membrane usher protein
MTLGVTTRVTDSSSNLGGQVITATAVANISADIAASYANNTSGMAVNFSVQPRLPDSWQKAGQSVDAFFEYATRDFAISEQDRFNRKMRAGLRYNRFLFDGKMPISATVAYTSVYGIEGESIDASLGIGYRLTDDLTLRATPSYRRSFGGQDEAALRLALTKTLGRRNRARGTHDTRNNRTIAEYDYRSQYGGIGTLGANVVASRSDLEPETLSTSVDYIANRFDVNAGYTHNFSGESASEVGRLRAGVSTAIAFAGSDVAIGRPVRDAFAIIGPHESLKGKTVIVSPGTGDVGDRARSGSLGPALVGDLGSYSLSRMTYDVPGIPPGYDLGAGLFEVFPPHRGGYDLTVGSNRRASSIGFVEMPDGTPLSYGVGTATSKTDKGFEPQTIFTNRAGRFGVLKMVPGNTYDVVFSEVGIALEIVIPEDVEGYVDVGTLKGKPQ